MAINWTLPDFQALGQQHLDLPNQASGCSIWQIWGWRGGHAKDDGGDTQTCQTKHTGARFGICKGVGGGPPKDDGECHLNLLNQAPACSIWQFQELGGGWVYKTESEAQICQIEHPHAQFCKSGVDRPTKMRVAGGWTYKKEKGWGSDLQRWWVAGPTKMRSMGVGFAKVDGWTYKNKVHGSQICEGGRWLDIQKREG